jgi:hypothetical protein
MITQAHDLFTTQTGDLHFVTVAHPKWELPVGNLDQANVNSVRQWLYRRFKRLATNLVAVGGIGVNLGLRRRVPMEDRHQLIHGRAVLGGQGRSRLAVQCGSPASLHRSRNQPPKPAAVNGRPYAVTRKVRSPVGLAAMMRVSSGSRGFSESRRRLNRVLLGMNRSQPWAGKVEVKLRFDFFSAAGPSPSFDPRDTLAGFETFSVAKERQQALWEILATGDSAACSLVRLIVGCRKGRRCRSAACPVCSRRFRIVWCGRLAEAIHTSYRDWVSVSLVPPDLRFLLGQLRNFHPNQFKDRLRKQLERGKPAFPGPPSSAASTSRCRSSRIRAASPSGGRTPIC